MGFPNNNLPLKSLFKGERCDRWYPKQVENFRIMLNIPPNSQHNGYLISKNIAYNLQYLEYLQKQIDEFVLSDIILKMLRKNYIIVAMGIIEGLFVYLLKLTNNWNTSEWKSVQKNSYENSKPLSVHDKMLKVQTETFLKVDKYELAMNLDAVIKRVEGKHLLKFDDEETFNVLSHLRKMRNRVHLHVSDTGRTEFYDFNEDEQKTMKKILYKILTHPTFCSGAYNTVEIYDFLI